MSVVLQISDTHFGTEQAPVMQALLQLAHAQKPDLLILSGDITQRARKHQFRAAANYVEQLAVPARVVVPGNHDIPLFNLAARALAPYKNFQHSFGAELEPEFESEDFLVLTVNSTSPTRHTNGEISARQMQRVAQRLHAASARQLRLVVLHHPVCAITESDKSNLAHGYTEAIEIWSSAGVDLIFGGHIHLPYVRALQTPTRNLSRAVWAVQAGTAISRRTRGNIPNSVNIVRATTDRDTPTANIERWDYQLPQAAFALVESTPMRADRAGT